MNAEIFSVWHFTEETTGLPGRPYLCTLGRR